MAWFGKKKHPALNELPPLDSEPWSVGEGENDGLPMFVRVNSGATSYVGHAELPTRMGVAVPLNAPNEHGLPGELELTELEDFEDRLNAHLAGNGRLVLVITTGGMREFISYVRSTAVADSIGSAVVQATPTHQVQFYAEDDAKWELYSSYAP